MLLHLWVHCRVPQSIFYQNIKGHSLLLAMTRHRVSGQVWACLGPSWFYLVWTMGWQPNDHSLTYLRWSSVNASCGQVWPTVGVMAQQTIPSFCLLRLALEQLPDLSWEPAGTLCRTSRLRRKVGPLSMNTDLPPPEESWGCWQLAESCCPILPGESHLHCLRSQRAAGRGSVTWEKKGSWTKDNCLLYFD